MATLDSILERTRLELGDQPKTFRQEWYGDSSTRRWELDYAPLDASTVIVTVNGVDVSDSCEAEEATGVLTFDTAPGSNSKVVVTGTYFRYFTTSELSTLVHSAVEEHLHNRVNAFNQALTVSNLPYIEEGVIAIRACIKALFVLATDASFDIDIMTPDGVSIPRSERYRQLMEMIREREQQYYHISEALNIGPYRVEVFTLRRISRGTNKYVPIYRPQEIDDYSQRERVYLPMPTYGAETVPSPATVYNMSMVAGDSFSQTFDYNISLDGHTVRAQIRQAPGASGVAAEFDISIDDAEEGLVTLSLTTDQTRGLPKNGYWDMQLETGQNVNTVMTGRVFVSPEVTRA